ncbi:MAG: hypothetical protein OXU25_09390 [Thaumarchaeota archaeon]|nr:hypothetical protein [Nitrososphaerota archaeon]
MDKAWGDPDAKTDAKSISINAKFNKPSRTITTLTAYQQHADLALAVTLQDLAESGQTLEMNERPAFAQNPTSVVRLYPEKSKERLITHVLRQYGGP